MELGFERSTIMKTTILVDNDAREGLGCEWGFSALIEADDATILLDTGASPLFADNARELGIDLQDVDVAVLSHAHFDHADGFGAFFELNDHAPLYLQEACDETCWSDAKGAMAYIGVQQGLMDEYSERLKRVSAPTQIAPRAWLVPHSTEGLDAIGAREHLYLKQDDEMIPDDFAHEQSLVFDTSQGLIIFNSCSHGGIETIINEARAVFPEKPIRALVGGLHLFLREDDEVRKLAATIRDLGIEKVHTGHCTGERALEVLQEELPETIEAMFAGQSFEL